LLLDNSKLLEQIIDKIKQMNSKKQLEEKENKQNRKQISCTLFLVVFVLLELPILSFFYPPEEYGIPLIGLLSSIFYSLIVNLFLTSLVLIILNFFLNKK